MSTLREQIHVFKHYRSKNLVYTLRGFESFRLKLPPKLDLNRRLISIKKKFHHIYTKYRLKMKIDTKRNEKYFF